MVQGVGDWHLAAKPMSAQKLSAVNTRLCVSEGGKHLLLTMSTFFELELERLVGIARGEQEYFDPSGVATATEACKSNALMRCCKDLGIASELW